MSDFSRVHGPGHDPKSLFARENAELRAQVQTLNQELVSRAAPAMAKALLAHIVRAIDSAREASSAITVIKNGSS